MWCGDLPQRPQSAHTLSNNKFEILFEMGLLAYADGYTREAVTTFAGSVEEFYRHIMKCIFYKHGLYEGKLYYETENFWKQIDKFSRTAVGSFCRSISIGIQAGAHLSRSEDY